MGRTVNRTPFSVPLPSSSDAKDYFFNHSNWKGMSDDKNFLTSDQETFESCKNVYIDSEGLLRSRPSIKTSDSVGKPAQIILQDNNFYTSTPAFSPEYVQTVSIQELVAQYGDFVNGVGHQKFRISFDLRSKNINNYDIIKCYFHGASGTGSSLTNPVDAECKVSTEYQRFSFITTANWTASTEPTVLTFYGEYGTGNIPEVKNIKIELYGNDLSIENFWVFNNKILYLVKNEDSTYDVHLCDFENNTLVSSTSTDNHYANNKIKPILADNKIFIFSEFSFRYIDLVSFEIADAYDFIYTPITKVTSQSVESEGESNNVLSNSEIITYLYENGFSLNLVLDKTLKFNILGKEYEVLFETSTPFKLYDKLPITMVSGTCLTAIMPRNGYDSIAILDAFSRQFLYSINGEVWDRVLTIPTPKGTIKDLRFTVEGSEVYYIDECSVYNEWGEFQYNAKDVFIVSVVKTSVAGNELQYVFSDFTDFLAYKNFNVRLIDIFLISYSEGSLYYMLTQEIGPQGYLLKFSGEERTDTQVSTYFSTSLRRLFEIHNYTYYAENYTAVILLDYYDITLLLYNGTQFSTHLKFENVMASTAYAIQEGNSIIFYYRHRGTSEIKKLLLSNFSSSSLASTSELGSEDFYVMADGIHVVSKLGVWNSNTGKITKFLESPLRLLGASNYLYYLLDLQGQNLLNIYTNNISEPIELKEVIVGDNSKILEFSKSFVESGRDVETLSNLYFAIGNSLYITEPRYDEDGDFLWYIPKETEQRFNSTICALHPISTIETAIFLENEVWYSKHEEGIYSYTKSKLQVGLKDGSDVITSYDGTQVLFPTKRGLVALTYQNFVASTDQALTFLSDAIHTQFVDFCSNPVKLLRYQYWLICYRTDSTLAYVFDVRNNSWWPIELPEEPRKSLDVDNSVITLFGNTLYYLDKSDNEYKDDKGLIDWSIKSQKLHLNAVNYTKHIANITLMSVLDSNNDMSFKMKVNNYRKKIDTTEVQTNEYKIDAIRTYVQRVSFPKVNEFQYELFADDEQLIRVPLSLSGLTIKYRIGSQVR